MYYLAYKFDISIDWKIHLVFLDSQAKTDAYLYQQPL